MRFLVAVIFWALGCFASALPPQGFKLIPSGSFEMGDALDRVPRATAHMVQIKAFLIGETDVVFGEWTAVKSWAGKHGYQFDHQGTGFGEDHPVTGVSWHDTLKWCNAKSEKEGRVPLYYTSPEHAAEAVYRSGQVDLSNMMVKWDANGFRMPTEAEWERAARGGLDGKDYPMGDELTPALANYNSSVGKTTPVKKYPPNKYGLYDMAGNIWQWCWDWFGDYAEGRQVDPRGPETGTERVMRGGSWYYSSEYCKVAFRMGGSPKGNRSASLCGFRLACRVEP